MSNAVREIPLQDLPDLLNSFTEHEIEEFDWVTIHRARSAASVTLFLTSPHSDKALVVQ